MAEDGAASPVVSFVVALVVFSVLSYSIADFVVQAGTQAPDERELLPSVAAGVLAVLVRTPGFPAAWDGNADRVLRLGLESPDSSRLSPAKLAALHAAALPATANGKVDYEEARASLGLEGNGFHLTLAPRFDPTASTWYGVDGLEQSRVAYVGDVDGDGRLRAAALAEITKLDAAPVAFDPTAADATGRGDVFADRKPVVNALLPGRLAADVYTTLVVGSNVDHTALNDATVKFAVRDWVLRGGSLVVFGTTARDSQWMEPIFGAGHAAGAAGSAWAPDPTHPLLRTPNRLPYATLPTDGGSWQICSEYQDDILQVLAAGPSEGTRRNDVLSASPPAVYGNGTIILTTWLPHAAPGVEGERMLANFLMYGRHAQLYLDYGPPVPPDRPVATATRLAVGPWTLGSDARLVEMEATVHVWRS